ncbi:type 1 glutamine amidotransferase domain-containing protein [uncultured Aquimarina sp.]|uniref:type 1 glutamine amidotransferase domain-containing protein n=1 Tax=uncultured Aquimarina sp. TaxID=575652 RepID=UPI00262845B9|nr:type 1 glutamine amidotransferase domain-containing protein [uncultured Aquimarina sp.]
MRKLTYFIIASLLLISCGNHNNDKSITKKTNNMKNVLFVLTSHDELGDTGEKTGFWVEEFAAPYYFLKDKGVAITIASPKGGQPPIDPKSELPDFQTDATKRFDQDPETQDKLKNSISLSEIKAEDYDAIFYPGGHGPLWDLANDKKSISLIEAFYNQNKPVAAVCHAPAIFKNTQTADGVSLVKDKKVTGFSNSEEAAVQLTDIVPFLVEDMLINNGAEYSKGDDWAPYALEDGLIITGQNPASSELVAEKLLHQLQ